MSNIFRKILTTYTGPLEKNFKKHSVTAMQYAVKLNSGPKTEGTVKEPIISILQSLQFSL